MRRWLREILNVRDSPEAIARGMAVGVFFGVSIFWGLQLVLAVGAAWVLRGNKVIAAALTAVSNPLTTLPLYGLCYVVGRALVGGEGSMPDLAALHSLEQLRALGPRFLWTMLAGSTAVGVTGAAAAYLGAGRLLTWTRRWRAGRKARAAGERAPLRPAVRPGVTGAAPRALGRARRAR